MLRFGFCRYTPCIFRSHILRDASPTLAGAGIFCGSLSPFIKFFQNS